MGWGNNSERQIDNKTLRYLHIYDILTLNFLRTRRGISIYLSQNFSVTSVCRTQPSHWYVSALWPCRTREKE